MPYGCQGNDKCSTCMPCTPYSPCSPCTVWRQYSPWIQCPPKFGTPRKLIPKITTAVNFGGIRYEARDVLPTPPVLCSPPPYYPVLVEAAVCFLLSYGTAAYWVDVPFLACTSLLLVPLVVMTSSIFGHTYDDVNHGLATNGILLEKKCSTRSTKIIFMSISTIFRVRITAILVKITVSNVVSTDKIVRIDIQNLVDLLEHFFSNSCAKMFWQLRILETRSAFEQIKYYKKLSSVFAAAGNVFVINSLIECIQGART